MYLVGLSDQRTFGLSNLRTVDTELSCSTVEAQNIMLATLHTVDRWCTVSLEIFIHPVSLTFFFQCGTDSILSNIVPHSSDHMWRTLCRTKVTTSNDSF